MRCIAQHRRCTKLQATKLYSEPGGPGGLREKLNCVLPCGNRKPPAMHRRMEQQQPMVRTAEPGTAPALSLPDNAVVQYITSIILMQSAPRTRHLRLWVQKRPAPEPRWLPRCWSAQTPPATQQQVSPVFCQGVGLPAAAAGLRSTALGKLCPAPLRWGLPLAAGC